VVDAAVQGDVDAEGQESHAASLTRQTAAEYKIERHPALNPVTKRTFALQTVDACEMARLTPAGNGAMEAVA